MSKWFGKLGFVETKETELSVHSEIVTERDCYGDLTRNTRRNQSSDKVNDDIKITAHAAAKPVAAMLCADILPVEVKPLKRVEGAFRLGR